MDLLINVANLPIDGNIIDLHIKEKNVSVKEITGDIHVNAGIHKSGNSYNVKGFAEYDLRLKCSRCLRDIKQNEKRNFNLEFKEKVDYATSGKSVRETENTESENIVANDRINLGPFLNDEIILSIPMKPLCSEECMGLCPICGVNLNKTTCAHSKEKSLT